MSQVQQIIRDLRELGLSQSEIGRRTAIPQPRLSRWEAGNLPAGADDALKLAALLDAERRTREPSTDESNVIAPGDAPPVPEGVQARAA